ncbi:Fic family protein [Streptomyces sp. N35]|uniref:Fic family protein n=1 Tax=Streptomyces sp. N35 TaxID=2795730 RepID=UPI0018F51B87|nr:Fic family protein [Streptomyces sp. N35]
MLHDLSPSTLTWDEVDPARHPFDGRTVGEVVRSLGPALRVPGRPDVSFGDPGWDTWAHDVAGRWADAMSYALIEEYGVWASGWRWARDEGDFDGGPVGHWCCPHDSMTTPGETLAKVVDSLSEWRAWLEDLAACFEAHPLDQVTVTHEPLPWEIGARRLITRVADRTGCGSGWHRHCRQVLTWFLSRWGVAPAVAEELVNEAVGGRFHSWTEPEPEAIGEVAERLAGSVPNMPGTESPRREPDRIPQWLEVRDTAPWHDCPQAEACAQERPLRDGAVDDISTFDAAISPARAEGMLAALEQLRTDAVLGKPLTLDLLSSWQQHVLGTPSPPSFRTASAYAKRGRERYGLAPGTRIRFEACLSDAFDPGLPLTARAARAYLDVCYFHPFPDGNARAAFLTLLYVLARADITLGSVQLLRRVTFQVDSPQDPLALARYLDIHLRENMQRTHGS